MVSSPPKYMGGEIFLDPKYLGVIGIIFLHLGGKSHLGGTDIYLGGIRFSAWDMLLAVCYYISPLNFTD